MTFNVPAPRDEVVASDVGPIAGYLNGAAGSTYEHIAKRAGNSTTLYADSIAQRDTTNGYIFRAGYGASGSETWMLDITKNGIVIRGGALRFTGPHRYDVEAYANASDLNTDGSFKTNVSCTYAVDAAAAALRASTVNGNSFGPFGGNYQARIVFNSRVYTASTPMNLTKLSGAIIESGCGKSVIYSGTDWADAGAYDSGVSGTGTTISAANCPMMDLTGVNDSLIRGIQLYAQGTLTGAVPTTLPGAGFLIASLEVYNGAWDGTGGTFSSNNLVFERCSVLGYFGAAGFLINNSVIHNFTDCGGQIWTSSGYAHAFYCGRQTIGPASAAPTASGGVDSPFYPNPASPTTGDERMNRTETAAGAIVMTNCEWHDLAALKDSPTTGNSNVLSTILLYKVFQFQYLGGPMSASGRAGIEIQGFAKDITLFGVELYEDSSEASAEPYYWIFNNGCDASNPVVNVSLRDCFLNTSPKTAVIGGINACYSGIIAENNLLAGTTFYDTTDSFTGTVTDETLTGMSRIDCGGLPVKVGGSIGTGVELIQPGTVTYSGGGTDKHRTWTTGGALHLRQESQGMLRIGATPATVGDIRLYSTASVYFRNNANGANISALAKDASDNLYMGETSGSGTVNIQSTSGVNLTYGATTRLATTSSGVSVTGAMAATGAVSGTTGTFSSAVSGTTGTFSSAVSGTTGTFSSTVSGTTITASTALRAGSGTFATTGGIRLPNGASFGIYQRNVGNSADIPLASLDSSDNLTIGATSGLSVATLAGQNGVQLSTPSGYVQIGTASPATTATTGFPSVPAMAGAPTGTPSPAAGYVLGPIVDTTNNRIYVRYGGNWKYAALT